MAIIPKSGITNGGTIQASHVTNIIESLDGTGSFTIAATGSLTGSLVGTFTGTGSFTGSGFIASSATATSASYATTATSANTATSASFATTSSYAVTASYVANASSFPYTGSAVITGSLIVTGSVRSTQGFTGSFNGTASYAVAATRAEAQRTVVEATYYPVIVDSSNATAAIETLYTPPNITFNPGTSAIIAAAFSGSFKARTSTDVVDLSEIAAAGANGQFIIPKTQTGGTPVAGSMYFDDTTQELKVWSAALAQWVRVLLT